MGGSQARFALLVHHDDAEREFAYDRKSHIGTLDKAWDVANAKGWTVVSIKDQFRPRLRIRKSFRGHWTKVQ